MPVVPNNQKFFIDLDTLDAVGVLVDVARALDPVKIEKFVPSHHRTAADISDHLMFLSIVNPQWFESFRDEAVTELHDRLLLGVGTASVLLEGTSDAATEVVLRRLEADPTSWRDLSLAVGIGSEAALAGLADHTRRHPGVREWLNRLGVHVGPTGPALRRFDPQRSSLHELTPGGTNGGFVGLPVEEIAHEPGLITWHYLSFRPDQIAGLPQWPHPLLHIVSPRTIWFTLSAGVAADGRYVDPVVDDEGEPYDDGLLEIEADAPPSFEIEARPYNSELVVRNGHIQLTPGVLGTAGGPPIGIYPNPVCAGCDIVMFHGATIESNVREYGHGFVSAFYCPECVRASVTGTNWN